MMQRILLLSLGLFAITFPTLAAHGPAMGPNDHDKQVDKSTSDGKLINPLVAPGKIHWHPTLAAACEAAAKSGKPVFLFQMLGNLNQEFC